MVEKLVVIGSGPAGWTAALYAARANLNPLVFEGAITEENRQKGTLPLGQLALTTEVENYPGFPDGISGPELMERMKKQAVRFGARVMTDDVVKVDFRRRPLLLFSSQGEAVQTHAVIVATGARANYLGLPSEERFKNHGVSACAVCDGALPRFRNRPVVVIGGGDAAVEEASYLTKFASKVYIVHRRDKLRASRIMQQRAFQNEKIEIRWNRVLDEVIGNDAEGVTGVRLKSTVDDAEEELECSGLFVAIGHRPNTDFLAGQIELDDKGYIKRPQPDRMRTSVEGFFAAGDVTDPYYRQAITAAGTGCMAALEAERWLTEQGIQ